nr:uncharacterized protein Mb2253c-like [Aegilops tauschii subsp. strangulata]
MAPQAGGSKGASGRRDPKVSAGNFAALSSPGELTGAGAREGDAADPLSLSSESASGRRSGDAVGAPAHGGCEMGLCAAQSTGAGAGVLLVAPTGEHLKYVVQMRFPWEMSTNNIAEYEGLLADLGNAADLGVRKLIVRGDSQLVVRQINKDYQSPLMEAYVDEVRKLEERFDCIQAEHVPRAENDIADYLSKRHYKRIEIL